MNPNEAFKLKNRKDTDPTKKMCSVCGRMWSLGTPRCYCGNGGKWVLPKQDAYFEVWECMECGWKQNIYGSFTEGLNWLNVHTGCMNCGADNPGWTCLTT